MHKRIFLKNNAITALRIFPSIRWLVWPKIVGKCEDNQNYIFKWRVMHKKVNCCYHNYLLQYLFFLDESLLKLSLLRKKCSICNTLLCDHLSLVMKWRNMYLLKTNPFLTLTITLLIFLNWDETWLLMWYLKLPKSTWRERTFWTATVQKIPANLILSIVY